MTLRHETMLTVGIALLSLVLLAGVRLNARFAGGEGFRPHADAVLVRSQQLAGCTPDDNVERGEYFYTCRENAFAGYDVLGARIIMDVNTEMTLIDSIEVPPTLQLIGGRIVVNGPAIITVRDTSVEITGKATLVHYGWKYLLVLDVMEGDAIVTRGDNAPETITGSASIDTKSDVPPTETNFEFDYTSAGVKAFYEWALASS